MFDRRGIGLGEHSDVHYAACVMHSAIIRNGHHPAPNGVRVWVEVEEVKLGTAVTGLGVARVEIQSSVVGPLVGLWDRSAM